MDLQASDRRGFFRETLGKLLREVTARTEARVAPRRYFRPPGAADEIAFLASCTRCGDCIDVCPVHAIIKAPPAAGLATATPIIDPAIQACVVCDDMPCARACETGALVPPPDGWAGIHIGILELDPGRCITFQGAACGVCARACPVGERALALDGGGHPVLKPEGCVGCGVCVTACVTSPSSLRLKLPLE
ncbi:MAG TPA: 4Fe-4S dicluster domain-containing protein [Gemmatimonadales bacterium]|nr:4Fe-4S dicluster domain-containing protein [Gemmatimonadales bacterium]